MASNGPEGPIVLLTVFKSGTHLTRKIITELTGLPFYEPPIERGRVNYEDPGQLHFVADHFYSWHLFPNSTVVESLTAKNARCVLIVRNVFDLCVSMYHHFAKNIDADIGRGRNVDHLFAQLGKSEGISKIITGWKHPEFNWRGLSYHLRHIDLLLDLACEHPCFLSTHERLVQAKSQEVSRLAQYLGCPISAQRLQSICESTSFGAMKEAATAKGQGSHYRRGVSGSHLDELEPEHLIQIRAEIASYGEELVRKCDQAKIPEVLTSSIEAARAL